MSHTHYDTVGVHENVDTFLPLNWLEGLESYGIIGQAQLPGYSFMGFIPDPSEFVEITNAQVGVRSKKERIDGVVIGPTRPLCHQSVGD